MKSFHLSLKLHGASSKALSLKFSITKFNDPINQRFFGKYLLQVNAFAEQKISTILQDVFANLLGMHDSTMENVSKASISIALCYCVEIVVTGETFNLFYHRHRLLEKLNEFFERCVHFDADEALIAVVKLHITHARFYQFIDDVVLFIGGFGYR